MRHRNTVIRRGAAVACFLLVCMMPRVRAEEIRIAAPEAPGPVLHALKTLERVLSARGLTPAPADAAKGDIIHIGPVSAEGWAKSESYRIEAKRDGSAASITVAGSDPVGLMYGVYALAEQFETATPSGPSTIEHVHNEEGAPYLSIRADNPFITLEEDESISAWFYDEAFWEGYFDTLARNRYNLCDIHAMYSLPDTSFPNIFPYFLKNPAYPQASLANEDQEENLAMLNRIIDIGEDRGVHVALMNYSMDFPGLDHGDEAAYLAQTKWAVKEILDRCPKLWMFGFRIGESGRTESFFEEAYLGGIAAAEKKDVRLYTRTWLAEFKDLAKIGMKYPDNFFIEIKYNGEHLGAPYQAIQGRWGSYSYEKYLNYPRYWEIIWQVRANGTHRIFPWCDPEFARRTVESCLFGNGIGMTLEPITSYYTQFPDRVFKAETGLGYMYERYWPWYQIWGRLAYDPTTSDDVFRRGFVAHFGDASGESIYDSLVGASGIVPLIYRSHCLGPDHRTMAPEFESGNNTPIGSNIDVFSSATVLDEQEYLAPAKFVEAYLADNVNGKITPLEAADRLDSLAGEATRQIEAIAPDDNAEEWELLSNDLRALAHLARYYAEKNRAACALQFYYKTHDVSQATAARDHLDASIREWNELSETTAAQYKPILDPLRTGKTFTWADMKVDLEADLERLAEVEREIAETAAPRLGHVPVRQIRSGQDLELVAGLDDAPGAKVTLRYRIGDGDAREVACEPANGNAYRGTIPAADLTEGTKLTYSFAATYNGQSIAGAEATFYVTNDGTGPLIAIPDEEIAVDRGKQSLTVHCAISDPSGVKQAWVEWKPMPSDQPWSAPITLASSAAGDYSAEIPLTPVGLLYSFVAEDNMGNVSRAPSVDETTPYLAVAPWDPGLSKDMVLESQGEMSAGASARKIAWSDTRNPGRPGSYFEYSGAGGVASIPFSVDTFSDYRLTLATVVDAAYGEAELKIDGNPIGVLNSWQDVAVPVPVEREYYAPRLAPGQHTLTVSPASDKPVGIEGFRFDARPARIESFAISQSFTPFPGTNPVPYPVGNPDIQWRDAEAGDEGIIYLDAQQKPNEECYAYAATVLTCKEAVATELLVGSNDGCIAWLNGEIVVNKPGKRFFKYNEDRVAVNLKQGDNLLVLAVMQAGRGWMFNVNLESYKVESKRPAAETLR